MHHNFSIDYKTGKIKKPKIVTFYIFTKAGVDVADQLNVTRGPSKKKRRPMVTFYYILHFDVLITHIKE